MFEALHPIDSQRIDVAAYLEQFCHLPGRGRPLPRCPFCGKGLAVIGHGVQAAGGRFEHLSESEFCPSRTAAGRSYLSLTPVTPDPQGALAMRRAFKAKWELHYSQLEFLVPMLHHEEFLELLGLADRLRVWEHTGLTDGLIPYVLVALTDFAPQSGRRYLNGMPRRRYWIRFLYDSTMRRIEALWESAGHRPELHRVAYELPEEIGLPGPRHLLKSTLVPVDTGFIYLPAPPRAALPTVVPVVSAWFERHWPGV